MIYLIYFVMVFLMTPFVSRRVASIEYCHKEPYLDSLFPGERSSERNRCLYHHPQEGDRRLYGDEIETTSCWRGHDFVGTRDLVFGTLLSILWPVVISYFALRVVGKYYLSLINLKPLPGVKERDVREKLRNLEKRNEELEKELQVGKYGKDAA